MSEKVLVVSSRRRRVRSRSTDRLTNAIEPRAQMDEARERLERSRSIARDIEASLEIEKTRKRDLVETFLRVGAVIPPAPAPEASAAVDASSLTVNASMSTSMDIDASSSLEDVKRALALSQATARTKLAEARRARQHNDDMVAALDKLGRD